MHIYDMTLYILVDESKLSFHSINGPVKSINPLRWLNFLFHLRRSNRTCAIHTHDHTYMHVGRIKIIIPGFRGNNHDKCLINEIKFLIMITWPKGVSIVITFIPYFALVCLYLPLMIWRIWQACDLQKPFWH